MAMSGDGWAAEQVFKGTTGTLGFDDIVFLPGVNRLHESSVSLSSKLTKGSPSLTVPIVGGTSGSVSGVNMAVALAISGGIGIIHRKQSVAAQADMVRRVKQYENGFILDPYVLPPTASVADIDKIKAKWGCSGIPITDNGKMGGKLVGLVTARDVESLKDRKTPVVKVMTVLKDLTTAQAPLHLRDARDRMQQTKVGKLPVVNEDNELVALICRGDLKRATKHPAASRDANRQLLVAASLSADEQDSMERTQALINAGADIIVLDTSEGITNAAVEMVKNLKENCNGTDVLVGSVSSVREATKLLEAGADGLCIGFPAFGGAADAASTYEIARIARNTFGVPVCAEGVEGTEQMLKALCLGASTVSVDNLLARTQEAPGDHVYRDGVRVKVSVSEGQAKGQPSSRAGLCVAGEPAIRNGVVGPVVTRGSVRALLPHLAKKLRAGLQELGIRSVTDLHNALVSGGLRMERRLPQFPANSISSLEPPPARLEASSLHCRW